MRTPMLLPLLLLIVACVAHLACGGEEGADDSTPEVCREHDTPFFTLETFEACFNHDQCREGLCVHGYCAEECVTDDDCISFGYKPDPPSCEYFADADKRGCVNFCLANEGDCPALPWLPMKCEVPAEPLPSGISGWLCLADVQCAATSEPR